MIDPVHGRDKTRRGWKW